MMATWTGRRVSFQWDWIRLEGTVISVSATEYFATVLVDSDGEPYKSTVPLADLTIIKDDIIGQDAAGGE